MMMMNDNVVFELHIAGRYLFSPEEKRFIFLMRVSTFISIPILLHLSWFLFPLKPIFAFLLIILPLVMAAYFIEGEMDSYMRHLDPNFHDISALHRSQSMRFLKLCTLMAMVLLLWLAPTMGLFDLPLICKHAEMSSLGGNKNNLLSMEPCCHFPSPPPFVATDRNHGSCSEEVVPGLCPVKTLKEIIFREIIMSDNHKEEEEEEEEEKSTCGSLKFGVFCKWHGFRLIAMLVVCALEDVWIRKVKRDIADLYTRTPLVLAFPYGLEW